MRENCRRHSRAAARARTGVRTSQPGVLDRRGGFVEALEARQLLTATWTGAAGSNWSDPDNWQNGRTPAVDSIVDFPASATNKTSVNDLGDLTLTSLTIRGGGHTISSTTTGGQNPVPSVITFTGNGISVVDASPGATNTFNAAIHLNNAGTSVTVADQTTLVFGALVDGNGAINKGGTGTLVMPTANPDFDGAFNVNAGTVRVENPDALGSLSGDTSVTNVSTLELAAGADEGDEIIHVGGTGFNDLGALRAVGTLDWNGLIDLNRLGTSIVVDDGFVLTLHDGISGGDSIVKQGGGTLAIAASSNFGGGDVEQGVLRFQATTGTGPFTVDAGAAIHLQGNITVTESAVGPTVLNGTGVNNSGALQNVSGNNRWNGDFRAGSNTLIFSSAGTLTIGGAINTNGFTVTGGGPGNMEFSDAITGAGALTKSGAGRLTLSGSAANSYTGVTTVTAGALNVRKNSALGGTSGGTSVNAGGALELQGGVNVAGEALTLNGAGPGAGAGALLNVSGNNTWGGAVTLAGPSTIGSTAGTLTVSGPLNNGGNLLTVAGAGNVVLSGVVSGAGGLTKAGAGTLTLAGTAANTYTGTTTVNDGVLRVEKAGGLGNTAGGTVVGGDAALHLDDVGTVNEALQLGSNGAGGAGGLVNVSGNNTWAGNVALTGSSTVAVNAGSLTISGVVSGAAGASLTKTGPGTLTLSGVNTYAGATDIEDGQLNALGATALGSAAGGSRLFPGARLTFGPRPLAPSPANVTVNEPLILASILTALPNPGFTTTWAGPITLSPVTAANAILSADANAPYTISGAITGQDDLSKTGPGTITLAGTAANTYTGVTTVSEGVLALGKPAGVNAIPGDLVVNNTDGTATVRLLADNQISNLGNVTVSGVGLIDLNGNDETLALITLSGGDITTGAGVLSLVGDVTANSRLVTVPQRLVFQPSITGNLALGNVPFRRFFVGTGVGISVPTTFTVDGVISGTPALIKEGTQTMTLRGSSPNTYAGNTFVAEGKLVLAKSAGVAAVGRTVTVGDNQVDGAALPLDTLEWAAPDQVPDDALVGVNQSGVLDLNGFNDRFGPLGITGGLVQTGTGTLTLAGDLTATSDDVAGITAARVNGNVNIGAGPTRTFTVNPGPGGRELVVSANLTGTGTLVKAGTGVMELSGVAAPTFNSSVTAGTLVVTGSMGNVTVGTSTLAGNGTVGALTVNAPGVVSPSSNIATDGLTAGGNADFNAGSTFSIDLNGPTAGASYDQLRETGTVDLTGAALAVRMLQGLIPPPGFSFVIIENDGTDPVVGTFNNLPEGAIIVLNNTVPLRISYAGGDGNDVTLTVPGGPNPPPTVTGVFVNTPAWLAAFRDALPGSTAATSALGFAVPVGADQLRAVPWTGITQVSILFSQAISVQQGDLAVRGVNVPTYAFSSFAFDPATRVATWTLSRAVGNDKLIFDLDADSPDGVRGGAAGNGPFLDGEWTNGTDSFPSGNGTAGGDFRFRLNVLPGDADRGGVVNALDLAALRQRLNRSTTDPGTGGGAYSVFADLTGDGRINALDLSVARQRLNQRLPTGEPTALTV